MVLAPRLANEFDVTSKGGNAFGHDARVFLPRDDFVSIAEEMDEGDTRLDNRRDIVDGISRPAQGFGLGCKFIALQQAGPVA